MLLKLITDLLVCIDQKYSNLENSSLLNGYVTLLSLQFSLIGLTYTSLRANTIVLLVI